MDNEPKNEENKPTPSTSTEKTEPSAVSVFRTVPTTRQHHQHHHHQHNYGARPAGSFRSFIAPKQLGPNGPHNFFNKLRPLVSSLQLPTSTGCESGGSGGSSPTGSSLPSPSSSIDKTDNRDGFGGFLPDAPDMRREEERIKTFETWPVPFLSPERLAKNGFYYIGRGDEVRCAFCKVEIMRWVEGDDPAQDHQRWAPQCPFLRKHENNGNVPVEGACEARGRDECGARAAAAPARMAGPVHPRYSSPAARLRSFKDWPRSLRQKPEELAEAGFFYTGQGDKTKCFFCDGGLKDWEEEDVPWEQHARWFDRCAYVQLVKGRDYVQKVISNACVIPAAKEQKETIPAEAPAPEPCSSVEMEEKHEVEDSKVCRICYEEERNVCFVPCGHVVACAKCALSTDKCPMCRRTFTNAVRLYFS